MYRLRHTLCAFLAPAALLAQNSTKTDSAKAAPAPPALQLSGVIFAQYQTGGARGARAQNRFDVERVYLTVTAPAGDRVSVRFTSDLFVQRDSTRDAYYRGWTMRAKYAWLQYDVLKARPSGLAGAVRVGLVHTPIAEYEESFFARFISNGSTDRAGYFATADAGLASVWTLPGKRGELYVAALNGNGFTSRETDRFKDFGGRLSLTPFANRRPESLWSTLSLTPWYYKGYRASTATASAGDARVKDRYGFLAGMRDPRLRAGLQLGRRMDANDVAGVATPVEVTGSVVSLFTIAKPGALRNPKKPGPAALVLRLDQVRPDDRTDAKYRLLIAGLQLDLNPRAAVSFDMQVQRPLNGSASADSRTAFMHLVANF